MEQRSGLHAPERPAVHVEFNKPFKIEPPRGWLSGLTLDQFKRNFHPSLTEHTITRLSLLGSGEYKGSVSINGSLIPQEAKSEENLILPTGTPAIDIAIDPNTGLTLVRSLPIEFGIDFGPFSREKMKTGELGVSIFCLGKEYEAYTNDIIFYGSQGEQRAISTNGKWREVNTGRKGPMLLPSGADFRQIEFIIKDGSL